MAILVFARMKNALRCFKIMPYLLEHFAVSIAAITGVLVTLPLWLAGIGWRLRFARQLNHKHQKHHDHRRSQRN